MTTFSRPLTTGTFVTTDSFRSAPAHVAVMFEDDCTLVAVTGYADDPKNAQESMDYARLFAAAPELAFALKDFIRYHTDEEYRNEQERHADEVTAGNCTYLEVVISRAQDAIAKAKGE